LGKKKQNKLERFLNSPTDAKWNELVGILSSLGCVVVEPMGGSHWVVYHPGAGWQESIPVHNNQAKPVYYKKLRKHIREMLESERLWEEDQEDE